jgi:hypothetical protein
MQLPTNAHGRLAEQLTSACVAPATPAAQAQHADGRGGRNEPGPISWSLQREEIASHRSATLVT